MQSVSYVLSGLRNLVLSPSEPTVHSKLSTILDTFATTFFSELNESFQSVAQRSASSGHIKTTHTLIAETLKARTKVMCDLWKEARDLYEKIPGIDKPNEKAQALSCVMGIEMLGTHLERKAADFITVLTDPNTNQSLEESKKAIRDCEDLSTLGTIADKVTGLVELFTRLKPKILENTDKNLFFIHDTLVLYILYAAKSFKKEIPADSTVLSSLISQLEVDAKKLIHSYVVELDGSNPKDSATAAAVKPLLDSTKSLHLPNAYKFRHGGLTQWLARFPGARYRAMEDQINELEGIAKCVYKIECAFRDQVVNPCTLNKTTLQELDTQSGGTQMLTRAALCSLSDLPIAPELHAGFYYGFALRLQAKVLSTSIERFGQMATKTYKDHLEIVDMLTKALANRELDFNSITTLLLKKSSLQNDESHIATLLKNTIDCLVNQFSVVRDPELKMLDSLYKGTLDFQAESAVIERYLSANLIGYFYGTPARAFNPEFEVALFKLKTKYTGEIKYLFDNSPALSPLHTSYLKICEGTKHVKFIVASGEALSILATGTNDAAAKANEHIDAFCAKNPNNIPAEKLTWLKEKINKK